MCLDKAWEMFWKWIDWHGRITTVLIIIVAVGGTAVVNRIAAIWGNVSGIYLWMVSILVLAVFIATLTKAGRALDKKNAKITYSGPAYKGSDSSSELLPAIRPIVVPISYGKILSGPEMGGTGLGVRNDGEGPAYLVSASGHIDVPPTDWVHFGGTPQTLLKGETVYFPSYRKEGDMEYLGSRLYDFMVRSRIPSLAVPIVYKDVNENWYQTDASIIKDQRAMSTKANEAGLRFDWKQTRIPIPQATVTVLDLSADDPKVYPEISDEREGLYKRTPFILKNQGRDAAHNIQIQDLKIHSGKATFPIVDHIFSGKEEKVDPDVSSVSVLDSRSLTSLLAKEWNTAANLNLEDGLVVPMKLTYTDTSRRKNFEVSFDIVFNGLKDHLKQKHSQGYLKNEKTIFTKDIIFKRLS